MNIYETIAAVMGDIGAIGKDEKNQQQGWKYRGVDAVMNSLAPLCQKYKLIIVPEVLEQIREDRVSAQSKALIFSTLKMRYTFYAEDGTNISAVVIGEGMDSGDKSSNKAMSVAFKYACFQVFCIPTEEMIDPDAECHEVATPQASADKTKAELMGKMKVLMLQKNISEDKIKERYKVKYLNDLTCVDLNRAIAGLTKSGES